MSIKVNEIVTNRIIEELEKGLIPWQKPWTGQGKCINYVTRKAYSYLNELLLGKPGEYMTFKQVQDKKGSVKKGAKAHLVTFWKITVIEEKDKDNKIVKKKIPMLRYYNVFHISDIDGIESKLDNEKEKVFNDIETAETVTSEYYQKYAIKFENVAGDKACYSPSFDRIQMPLKKQFINENEYYSVLFHETVHSTGHDSRLKRITKTAAFGGQEYSKEELVAEIGSSILMNQFGIETPATFKNNVAYIQSWLQVLKNDNNFIISASSKANKAVELINNKEVIEEVEA